MSEMHSQNVILKIRVLDDNVGLCAAWVDKVRAVAAAPGGTELDIGGIDWSSENSKKQLKILDDRRRKFIATQQNAGEEYEEQIGDSIFDDISVLFVDYKLFDESTIDARRLTGLELAYLIRAFTSCKIIVAMNSQGGFMRAQRHFDLTLRDAAERIENLHITTADIGDAGLWRMPSAESPEYRPWSWPLLAQEVARHDERMNLAAKLLADAARNEPLVTSLGFKDEKALLPAFAIDHLGFKGIDTTANGFLWESGNVVRGYDFDILHPVNALERKEAEKALYHLRLSRPCVRLLGAAIHRWLERMVLPTYDVLIDRPHLLMRWPGLALETSGKVPEMTAWGFIGMEQVSDLTEDDLSEFAFVDASWFSRPVYWWPRLQSDEDLASRLKDANRKARSLLVFQEDTSCFARSASSYRFRCGLPSSNSIRYCAGPENHPHVAYEPESRLAE